MFVLVQIRWVRKAPSQPKKGLGKKMSFMARSSYSSKKSVKSEGGTGGEGGEGGRGENLTAQNGILFTWRTKASWLIDTLLYE